MRSNPTTIVTKVIRCAVYTRKSTEEGLDQEFNSLDAQREACAAYVVSQRHEGWTLIEDHYDDGGYSGGTLDRPALKRLLADIAAGRIDVVVIYKVDRLTRALSDFSRIVDVLDAAGASFVSITQSFNTTTSMGRLMLNVLLSFAQFEREVISERVRDKVAASKRKGMWMGGPTPLGYDAVDRKLLVNEVEAERVRHIFRRYLALGSVRALAAELVHDGITSKLQRWRNGRTRGGAPMAGGALYQLLARSLYRGEIVHKGQSYPGQHQAIVPLELWEQVQALLAANGVQRQLGVNARNPSLLAGMITDSAGRGMTPSHAAKGSLRYRYYVSPANQTEGSTKQGLRIPAGEIEAATLAGLQALLADEPQLISSLLSNDSGAGESSRLVTSARTLAAAIPTMAGPAQRALLLALGLAVAIGPASASASIECQLLAARLEVAGSARAGERLSLPMPGSIPRRGHELRLTIAPEAAATHRDGRLIALLHKAEAARRQLLHSGEPDASTPAYSQKHLARMARLAFLAPDIVATIVDGVQPAALTARRLLRISELPIAWDQQRRLLGFS